MVRVAGDPQRRVGAPQQLSILSDERRRGDVETLAEKVNLIVSAASDERFQGSGRLQHHSADRRAGHGPHYGVAEVAQAGEPRRLVGAGQRVRQRLLEEVEPIS